MPKGAIAFIFFSAPQRLAWSPWHLGRGCNFAEAKTDVVEQRWRRPPNGSRSSSHFFK